MYYPDLSRYEYTRSEPHSAAFNIGWLDAAHPYPLGDVPHEFLERLWVYCCHPVYLSFGYHTCTLCGTELGVAFQRGNERRRFGSAEIRVVAGKVAYAAPNLIYHYVVDHRYCPPDEFVQAVMQQPLPPDSPQWQQLYADL
ncbi:MAG TPA: hypothetical protein VFS21_29675 [Roseiflexaceae bacterium]|nr:hypothetical protein [Roseiflexaceae bacterium]